MNKNFVSVTQALRWFLVVVGSVDRNTMETAPRFALLFWAERSAKPSMEEVTDIFARANQQARREALRISREFGAVPAPAEFTELPKPRSGWVFADDTTSVRLEQTPEGWTVEAESVVFPCRILQKRWRQAERLAK